MKLSDLKSYFPDIQMFNDCEIQFSQIKRSNTDFKQGDVFVAIEGNSWDGHSFILEACQSSSLIVLQNPFLVSVLKAEKRNFLLSQDSREDLEKLANILSGSLSQSMYCVGITGTNGKTTTNYCVESVLKYLGKSPAILGTIDHHLGKKVWDTKLTSPGPIEFYTRLGEMKKAGADALSMEISSHSLDQKRNHSVQLDAAVFTNLSQDHLDYHKTMDEYFLAKKKLVSEVLNNSLKEKKYFLFNKDDSWSEKFGDFPGVEKIGFGKSPEADIRFEVLEESFSGIRFKLYYRDQEEEMNTSLVGDFNLYNLSAAIGIGLASGKTLRDLKACIESIHGVNGRMEPVVLKSGIHAFVDFSHTPDSLEKSLSFLKDIKSRGNLAGEIICVFGAGGDRDKGKRPMMAKAVESFADRAVVCSDNPRTEDPESILDDIMQGFSDDYQSNVNRIEDRKLAIYHALQSAKPGDVVIVAGKGHESYQEISGKRYEFSDQEVIRSFEE